MCHQIVPFRGKGSVQLTERPEDTRTPETGDNFHDPEEMGPLGEPAEEETPRGTFVLLAFFLIALVVLWFLVYYQLLLRG
jgi:hypothetical protein